MSTRYNTCNQIGSTDVRDMSDNAKNLDVAINTLDETWNDRFGVKRTSIEGAVQGLSFFNVGTFAAGYTLTNSRQTLTYDGHEYSWAGAFPKVVAAGSTPTPLGSGWWVDRSDVTLRGNLSSDAGQSLIGAFSSVAALRLSTGLTAGRKIQLLGYYTDTNGVGGGTLTVTEDSSSADNGGTIFVTADGKRVKRERKTRLYSSDFGARGDWDGATGTDNKAVIEKMIAASNSAQPWCINQDNVGVSSISISNKSNWLGIISGSVVNISAKSSVAAQDDKDTAGGVLPTFKITNCTKWEINGGYVDNRYREAFYVENCSKFVNKCDINGSSLNNNLKPNYYRHCTNFKVKGFRHEGMSEKPATGYYSWAGGIWLWDCSSFKITDFEIIGGGSNGVYIGSNCRDFVVASFTITLCGMSGIQLAWSSFGTFPYRGSISDGLINGCRSDGIDVNNTAGGRAWAKLTIANITSVNNGYNDDGTVTADGSGMATLFHVTHVDVIGCNTEDPARAGIYINDCANIKVFGGSTRKEKTTNNSGEGLYIQDSDDVYVAGLDVKMAPGREALKLFGTLARIRIGGTYNGVISIPAIGTTTYDDVKLKDATLVTPSEVQAYIPLVDCKVTAASSNAVRAFARLTNVDAISSSGIGLIFGAAWVKVSGGKFQGSNSGSYCSSFNGCTLDGAECIGGAGPASHWVASANSVITNNKITAGSGNSILTDSACTDTIKFGNQVSGIQSLGGTFNINY